MHKIGGPRRRTRTKLKKHYKEKGKISLSRYFQTFETGDRVLIDPEPSVQKGMCHSRFMGLAAKVITREGSCYHVEIQDGGKSKILIMHPVHLKRI